MKILNGYSRFDVIKLLNGNENLGLELGIAEGIFSSRMINSGRFKQYTGIDMYAGGVHNTDQYKRALVKYGLLGPHKLLRMKFEDALDLFPDQSLDFIYVDGYAHNGEEGGKTIFDWHKKLKVGGIMAGDDYDKAWPLVVEAVNSYSKATNSEPMVTEIIGAEDYCRYPSWCIIKQNNDPIVQLSFSKSSALLVDAANLKFKVRSYISKLIPISVKKLIKKTANDSNK